MSTANDATDQVHQADASPDANFDPDSGAAVTPNASRYGRARLWLGMTTVGSWVVLASLTVWLGGADRFAPMEDGWSHQVMALLAFVGLYMALHLPFDFLGGYLLPRRYGRDHLPLARYAATLLRGIAVHGGLLFGVAVVLLIAGRFGGADAVVGAVAVMSLGLLAVRGAIARLMAPLRLANLSSDHASDHALNLVPDLPADYLDSADEGFTGGIVGVLRPRRTVFPARWQAILGTEGMAIAHRRRQLAIETGGWQRGRWLALVFTLTGVGLSALLVGDVALGTAAGIVKLSLVFTLWSFVGLLILPTVSRTAVMAIDARLREADADGAGQHADSVRRLDALQDGEPQRPSLVETIFHPIPSVNRRLEAETSSSRRAGRGAWDAARTSIYLSAAGLSLLGRAVHCNCGRPALWVWLPTD